MCPVDLIFFFDVANDTLQKRLMGRAAAAATQRADDNAETIKKRIEIFNEKNGEIVNHFQSKVVHVGLFLLSASLSKNLLKKLLKIQFN